MAESAPAVRRFNTHQIAFAVLWLTAGVAITAGAQWGNILSAQLPLYACERDFDLLSPQARCNEDFSPPESIEFEKVAGELDNWIMAQQKAGKLDHASVYFRDLNNGPWFGLQEYEEFSAASLFKVPIMIAILKEAENNPALLSETLGLKEALPEDMQNNDSPETTALPGYTYTVDALLYKMIVFSDNASKELLNIKLKQLHPETDTLYDTFLRLGLLTENHTVEERITIKSYSALFRILYNASYLNREMSQKALDLLAESAYKDGIVTSVPKNIRVAHKFGVRENEDQTQLHDCGIVYHPVSPYLLCIMTRGKNMRNNELAVHEISRRVFEEVELRAAERD